MFRGGVTGGLGSGGAPVGRGKGRGVRGGGTTDGCGVGGGAATGRGAGVGRGRATGFGSGGGADPDAGRGGEGTTGLTGDAGGCPFAGRVAIGVAVVGSAVPQYPQNLLPSGKEWRHLAHVTWGTPGATTLRCAGEETPAGGVACSGFPQRAHTDAMAGFMFPQDAQRI